MGPLYILQVCQVIISYEIFLLFFLYQHLKQIAKVVIGLQSSHIKTGELFEAGRQKTLFIILNVSCISVKIENFSLLN